MQLGEQAAGFAERGYGVAGLTYDKPELLRHFRSRYKVGYTLLSDADSQVIRAFGILNDEIPKDHEWYGVPHPGMYVINATGIVEAKFFEESVVERYTAASALHHIDAMDGVVSNRAETEHLRITLTASDYQVRPGNRVTLKLNVALGDGLHVYAPGVTGGYKPVEWRIIRSPAWKAHEAEFPESKTLHLPVIDETVPVFDGNFVIKRDITMGQLQDLAKVVNKQGIITVKGAFRYQACDDKECYRPREVELEWQVQALLHNPERAPEELRR